MRVLIGCETSGRMREAFRRHGHDAYSCDLLASVTPSPWHLQRNVLEVLDWDWDLAIFHPDCTYLCNSGVRWLTTMPKRPRPGVLYGPARWLAMEKAAEFFNTLWNCRILKVAIENPVMHKHAKRLIVAPKFTQTVQPWMFGDGEVKRTCFWLRGLPKLVPTNIVAGRVARVHRESPGPERWKKRSITYPGIADAAAEQWGVVA